MKIAVRIISSLLAFIMALGSLPPVQVFANAQANIGIGSLRITDQTVGTGAYTALLNWVQPANLDLPGGTGVITDINTTHGTEGYDVSIRNASLPPAGQGFPAMPQFPNEMITIATNPPLGANLHRPSVSTTLSFIGASALSDNSIYVLRVVPWHMHPTPNEPPLLPGGRQSATPVTTINDALYLTDIEIISARGVGNSMTVTWFHPTFDGADIFSGYRMAWSRGSAVSGSGAAFPTLDQNWGFSVMLNNPAVIRGIDPQTGRVTLTYTFQLAPGEVVFDSFYAIRIEPMGTTGAGVPNRIVRLSDRIWVGGNPMPIAFTSREFRYNSAYFAPRLDLRALGGNVHLNWPPQSGAVRLELWRDPNGFPNGAPSPTASTMVTFTGAQAATAHWFSEAQPSHRMYYRFVAIFPDGSRRYSNIVWFDPAYVEFYPYVPTIREIIDNVPDRPLTLDIDFRAFTRQEFFPERGELIWWEEINRFQDEDIMFDFWVTDRLEHFNNPALPPVIEGLPAAALVAELRTDPLAPNPGDVSLFYRLAPNFLIRQFVRFGAQGFELVDLEDNTVYYIRITARRIPFGSEDRGPSSGNAYGAHFIPPSEPLHLRPQMMQAPPLRIAVDAGRQDIGTNHFSIQWDMAWAEIFDTYDNTWSTLVNVNEDGDIVYGNAAASIVYPYPPIRIYQLRPTGGMWIDGVRAELQRRGATEQMQLDTLAMRMIELPHDTDFELHVVEYDNMRLNDMEYEDYLNWVNSLSGSPNWQLLVNGEDFDPDSPRFLIGYPDGEPLSDNTAYVAFLRPVVTRDDASLVAWWPAFITATTLVDRPDMIITPPTPRLEVVHPMTSETTITVRWRVENPLFDYELRWHELISYYYEAVPNTRIDLGLDTEDRINTGSYPTEQARLASVGDVNRVNMFTVYDQPGWVYYTVTGLFPNTLHYFWINASHGERTSAWSNPVDERTLDIGIPAPPRGLGLISNYGLEQYNREHGTNWLRMGYIEVGDQARRHYMIIEWMRILSDIFNTEAPENTPTDADRFSGVTNMNGEWLQSAIFEEMYTYVAQFLDLRPNTRHYIRARTVLTITRRPGGLGMGIYRAYSYRVQISECPDFTDFFEIIIPALVPPDNEVDNVNSLRRESEWTRVISLVSGRDDDDFDGNINADMFPLPDQDFEVTFDNETGTLTYRFRSDQIGADGLRDQQVDQRFISRLVANRTFNFDIDMSFHRDYLISRRVVEMPYSIFAAFNDRQINLNVTSGFMTFTLPYGALDVAEVRNLPDFGRTSTVRLIIETNPAPIPYLAHTQGYSAHPQSVAVTVASPTRNLNITSFARPVDIGLVLNDPADRWLHNVNAFWSHPDIYGWQPLPSDFDDVSGLFSTEVYRVGTFALIVTQAPYTVSAPYGDAYHDNFSEALYIVKSAIIISDLIVFDPNALIEANQFNNIVHAFMTNGQTAVMNRNMPRSEHQSLGRAGLLATGTNVRNDAGLAIFARLYELRTRSTIRGFSPDAVSDIDQARAQHREGILKAAHIGLLEGSLANPEGYMTFGQFMHMLAVLIEDAG